MHILILGGTNEARELAERLVGLRHDVTTSLAGRTREPAVPHGDIRVGKFGGVPGLVAYLRAARIDRLVDATHPYAEAMSTNAVAAAAATGIPLVRYVRPAWSEQADDNWTHVPDTAAAAAALPPGAVVLVTSGHEGLETILMRDDCEFVVRLIEAPDVPLPRYARLRLGRPPYALESERALLAHEGITHLVTKNSGGATEAKLEAARQAGVVVVMIDRPALPPAHEVSSLEAAIAAIGA